MEFAFFGALTSVGALFVIKEKGMEEKVLIKSVVDVKSKIVMISTAIFSLFLGIMFLATVSGYNSSIGSIYDLYVALGSSFLLLGILIMIIFAIYSKCELQITENNVRGKTIFGKEVILPLSMVSSYSTRKFLSVIAVATSSGVTKFSLIGNYREIGDVLSKKINERQDNIAKPQIVNIPVPQNYSMDDLKKLKDLLDAGIINQEEFDAKKKQLLGL